MSTHVVVDLIYDFIDGSLACKNAIEAIEEAIRAIPEVVECYHTLGLFDILVKIYARSNSHLLRIIQTQLKPLGVIRSETTISCRESFSRQLPFDDQE